MKKTSRLLILMLICFNSLFLLTAKAQYNNFRTMSQKIDLLVKTYPQLCSVKSITKTSGGKEIFVISIGTGNKDNKPAIAVVGGVEGTHLLGKELALGFAQTLLKESSAPEIKELLQKITFYILPDVSPDATEQFFSDLKFERAVNSRPVDDDRDFVTDEDPCEDLNKDGLITFIRIKDPSGKYIESDEDKRIMVMADLSKGQTGGYLLFSEGIDNDDDGNYNEDGPGGVCFNRNFTYDYEAYGLFAGLYPVSEPETKAVADFLYDHFNIFSVFTFGPQDNLGQPLKSSEKPVTDRRITSITKNDEVINKLVSEKYHEITGAKGSPLSVSSPGNFMDWAYYHYGRYSFSTPAWWFPVEKDKNAEVSFLKFAEKNKIDDVFIPWTAINHPGFPDKIVEIGGLKPFVMNNPPADTLGDLIAKNYQFLIAMAELHPELEFLDVKSENKGDNIFRVSLKLHNKGVFATCAEIGDRNIWTRIMRISLDLTDSQSIISGKKVERVSRLEGDQYAEFSWLISGKGTLKISAGALNTGSVITTSDLK